MASLIYEELIRRANYALRSHSRNLVYETYGAAKMAYTLKVITKDELYTLNDMLIKKGLNDPANCKLY